MKKNSGDFLALVSVEGRGSFVYVEGLSDLARKPFFLPLTRITGHVTSHYHRKRPYDMVETFGYVSKLFSV